MILPERVLGSSSVSTTVFGRAIGAELLGDVLAHLLAELGVGSLPPRRMT